MFGLFGKRKHYERLDDSVWMTAAAKQAGVVRTALAQAQSGETVAICCLASGMVRSYRDAVANAQPELRVIEPFQATASSLKSLARAGAVRVHVTDLHPRLAHEERFLAGLDAPDLKVQVQFHASLDDPRLRPFVTDKLKAILETLGMKPEEAITHRWVTRAIENARRKGEGG